MTLTLPARPPRESLAMRVLLALPVVGTLARDIARDPENIYYALVIVLTVVAMAVRTWGLPALAMAALAAVPVLFVVLVLITRG